MGSDNIFHKRKAKAKTDLDRTKAKRSPYDKVLIMCEGEKTEPNYFNELIDFYKLNSANVEVDGSCGSSPKSIFEKAFKLFKKEEGKGDRYDKIYCVFDKDTHETYEETIERIAAIKPKGIFFHINSIPCFEYWLILHYVYSTKPYGSTSSKSIAEMVLRDLKTYMPDYEKGDAGVFMKLHPQIGFAKSNAIRAESQARENHTDNPSTKIYALVDYLQKLKE